MHTIDEKLVKKLLKVIEPGLVAGMGTPIPGKMCVEAAVCFALGLPHGDDPECVSSAVRALKICLNDAAWSNNLTRAEGMKRLAIAQLGTNENFDDKVFAKRCTELVIGKYVPMALRAAAKANVGHADELEAVAVRCEVEKSGEAASAARFAARNAATDTDTDSAAYAAGAAAVAVGYTDAAADVSTRAAAAAATATATAVTTTTDAAADAAADAADHAACAVDYAATRYDTLAEFAEDVVQLLIEMGAEGTKWLYLTECDK